MDMGLSSGGNGNDGVDGDRKVGYGRPPRSGRIRKGEVRNPHGRNGKPKGAVVDLFGKALERETRVTIGGETTMMTSEEAYYMRMMAMALDKNVGAMRIVGKLLAERERRKPVGPTAEEQARAAEELEQKWALSAKLVTLLNQEKSRRRYAHLPTMPGREEPDPSIDDPANA